MCKSRATHRALYMCKMFVRHMVRRDISAIQFDRVIILFILALFYWLKQGRKPEYPEKTTDDEIQKMPHTKARKFKPQARLELAQ